MSRIITPPVSDGDPVNAATLNQRFTAFVQPNALDSFNLRGAACDLPQFTSAKFLATQLAIGTIGDVNLLHSSYNTVNGQITGDPPHVVRDGGAAPTPLALGAGWSLGTSNILRVYWNLAVHPYWDGARDWDAAGNDLVWTFQETAHPHPAITVSNGLGCWVFWLQWDITSAALVNWANVPGQGDFNTVVAGAGRGGELLSACQASSVVASQLETAFAPAAGRFDSRQSPLDPAGLSRGGVGWTTVDGAWHYAAPIPQTIYGLRVVFSGPFGAFNNGTNNYLVRSDITAADCRLDYNGGSIQALLMRKA